jgi:hypothetical protein
MIRPIVHACWRKSDQCAGGPDLGILRGLEGCQAVIVGMLHGSGGLGRGPAGAPGRDRDGCGEGRLGLAARWVVQNVVDGGDNDAG